MVVPAALSAERLPAPPARGPRVPVALSLALHGLAIIPLLLAGVSGSSANDDEPALMVELSLAAPTAGPAAEADQPESTPDPQPQPELPTPPVEATDATPPPEPEPQREPPTPPVEATDVTPPPEPEPPPPQEVAVAEPEIKVELPPPDEPPPPTAAEMKPVEPPKPRPKPPQPKPAAAPRPAAQAAVTKAPSPDAGNASITQQQAASSSSLIVFEGKPRYRVPPTPAVYPPRSIELGQQGEVLVRVRLQPDGAAAEIVLWRSSNFPLLDRSALAAVRGWHFLPAMRDGRPVAAWVEIPVRFHLR